MRIKLYLEMFTWNTRAMTETHRANSARNGVDSLKLLLVLVVVSTVVFLAFVAAPANAHESETVDGYELTFGGGDEPVITGERMWLELEVVDANGEPVPGQADSLEMELEHPDGVKRSLELAGKHGEPAYYEAPVLFTDPGTYTIHFEGTVEDTAVHVHFEKEVQDHTALQFPAADANEDQPEPTPQESSTFPGLGIGFAVVLVALGAGGALFVRRRD